MSEPPVLSQALERLTAAGCPIIATPSVFCNMKSAGFLVLYGARSTSCIPGVKHCISNVRTTGCYISI